MPSKIYTRSNKPVCVAGSENSRVWCMDNLALAALENSAAFFVCANNPKKLNSTAQGENYVFTRAYRLLS